jgi:hypothetical protein
VYTEDQQGLAPALGEAFNDSGPVRASMPAASDDLFAAVTAGGRTAVAHPPTLPVHPKPPMPTSERQGSPSEERSLPQAAMPQSALPSGPGRALPAILEEVPFFDEDDEHGGELGQQESVEHALPALGTERRDSRAPLCEPQQDGAKPKAARLLLYSNEQPPQQQQPPDKAAAMPGASRQVGQGEALQWRIKKPAEKPAHQATGADASGWEAGAAVVAADLAAEVAADLAAKGKESGERAQAASNAAPRPGAKPAAAARPKVANAMLLFWICS